MRKIKILILTVILSFLVAIPGFNYTKADETIVTPNTLVVFKIGDSNYYTQDLNSGVITTKEMGVEPLIRENRTFVPVRYLSNALGVSDSNIEWDIETKTATLRGKSTLVLTIGVVVKLVNADKNDKGATPFIHTGRTMLPARYVAEGLGFTVEWKKEHQIAICYPKGTKEPDLSKVLEEIKKNENIEEKPVVTKPGDLPPGVRNVPAWGKIPTIPVENGVEVQPPISKTHVYSIEIDIRVPGAVDNACDLLSNIMSDPSAGEKAKAIILEGKKDSIHGSFAETVKSGKHDVYVASSKNPVFYIEIAPLD